MYISLKLILKTYRQNQQNITVKQLKQLNTVLNRLCDSKSKNPWPLEFVFRGPEVAWEGDDSSAIVFGDESPTD